jgi:hypothetical protein
LLEVDPELVRDLTARMEVGEQGKADPAEVPRPVGVRVFGVDGDARDDGVGLGSETVCQRIQRRYFAASGRGPVEGIEEQENVALPLVVAEVELGSELRLESEIRRWLTDFDHEGHRCSP